MFQCSIFKGLAQYHSMHIKLPCFYDVFVSYYIHLLICGYMFCLSLCCGSDIFCVGEQFVVVLTRRRRTWTVSFRVLGIKNRYNIAAYNEYVEKPTLLTSRVRDTMGPTVCYLLSRSVTLL